jgi:maltose/moltooligosaccharide transporter
VPDTLYYSFDLGALVLFCAVAWTVLRTREYPPETLHAFSDATPEQDDVEAAVAGSARQPGKGLAWAILGLVAVATVAAMGLDRQLYLASGMALAWGVAQLVHAWFPRPGFFGTIMRDLENMPLTMRRLIPMQFFSWLALFSMWLYTTAAVTQVHFHSSDPASQAYNDGADWVSFLFGAYNGFAALAAVVIPFMVRKLGLQRSHLINVWFGAFGLISIALIRDYHWLVASMLGIGFAWASILSLPYALLSDSVPSRKMGLYMGIFNFFIVIPQLVAASVLGAVLKTVLGGKPIGVLVLGGVCFLIAGLLALRVPLHTSPARPA